MTELRVQASGVEALDVEVVAVPFAGAELEPGAMAGEGWLAEACRAALTRAAAGGDGERTEWASVGQEGRPDALVVRVPRSGRTAEDALRRAAGLAVRAARERRATSLAIRVPDGLAPADWGPLAEGALLGDWSYDGLKDAAEAAKRPRPTSRVLWVEGPDAPAEGRAAARRGEILARVQNATRELVAQPGNVVTPRLLGEHARSLSDEYGLAVQVWGVDKLRDAGFGGLLAVARGSAEEPRFVILEHAGEGGQPIVVVGKGVTFDAGGISLKPAVGMEDMKYDMAGAAAVLGIMRAVAELGVPQRLIGLVPATENLPSGTALKPGDVIRGESGKSIEVVNTDAEGRLILSDALSYASKLSPRAIVDLATLTGACVVALGHAAAGLMTPSDTLAAGLTGAGDRAGERVWRLPLWPEYRRQLDSDIADLKNTGGRPASAITAGRFLQEFVGEFTEWAHLDIAGTAWAEEAGGWQPKGATGFGVRLILEWLRQV